MGHKGGGGRQTQRQIHKHTVADLWIEGKYKYTETEKEIKASFKQYI